MPSRANTIVRSDPPERFLHHSVIAWCTRHYLSDGTHLDTWEEEVTRGLCGLRNQDPGKAPLGALHPQCVRCHELGHCVAMCPVEVPGFVCTASMDPTTQEAQWRHT